MGRIDKLKEDLETRIKEECEYIQKADNPRRELEHYIKNIRWSEPELAAFIKKIAFKFIQF